MRTSRAGRRATHVALLALLSAPLGLAACGSGSGPGSAGAGGSGDASLRAAGTKVEAEMSRYLATVPACATQSQPVVCVEAADRTLGAQIHDYANVLAVGHDFSAPATPLNRTRNAAQTLANSLEILGDAQPTQANYDQVRNSFDVNGAVASLQRAVAKVDAQLGG